VYVKLFVNFTYIYKSLISSIFKIIAKQQFRLAQKNRNQITEHMILDDLKFLIVSFIHGINERHIKKIIKSILYRDVINPITI